MGDAADDVIDRGIDEWLSEDYSDRYGDGYASTGPRDISSQLVRDKFAEAQRVTWDTGTLPARFAWALNEDTMRLEEAET